MLLKTCSIFLAFNRSPTIDMSLAPVMALLHDMSPAPCIFIASLCLSLLRCVTFPLTYAETNLFRIALFLSWNMATVWMSILGSFCKTSSVLLLLQRYFWNWGLQFVSNHCPQLHVKASSCIVLNVFLLVKHGKHTRNKTSLNATRSNTCLTSTNTSQTQG